MAKLNIASFFDAIPHGQLLAALRLPRANVFLLAFERAGIVFLRSLDEVTILAASPTALGCGLGVAISRLESLGMSLRAEKTQAAWLGGGEPPVSRFDLPGRGLTAWRVRSATRMNEMEAAASRWACSDLGQPQSGSPRETS